jgi:hypothetical protein
LIAFDCTLGLPRSYAAQAGLHSFREALAQFGHERWSSFYDVASSPAEIALERPFYPVRSAGTSRGELSRVLGESAFALRDCDRATGAGPLFWLVGPKQCGRSSISVWRDVITPQLSEVALWPFDGPLDKLLATGKPVIAEMYPAFLLGTLGLEVRNKRDPAARKECGRKLLEEAKGIDLIAVRQLLLDGFGSSPAGEDAFDAVTSAVALAHLVRLQRLPEPPEENRLIEGWIIGL